MRWDSLRPRQVLGARVVLRRAGPTAANSEAGSRQTRRDPLKQAAYENKEHGHEACQHGLPPPRVLSVVAGSEVRAAPNDGGSIIDSAKAYNVALANGARRTDRRADVKRDRIRVQPPVIKM